MSYVQEEIKPYEDREGKREQVERMFDHIAHSYDPLNHLLSFGFDKGWRRKAVNVLKGYNPKTMIDIATGTGDFALLNYLELQPKRLVGVDISEGMMEIARKKAEKLGTGGVVSFQKADCAHLPFADESFEAATVAFGVRNFELLDKSLEEIRRILKPGCPLVILELSEPPKFPMKQGFRFYANFILPLVGKMISKDSNAYTYLPKSIRAFPQGEVMNKIILKAGFEKVVFKRLTGGICTLYVADK